MSDFSYNFKLKDCLSKFRKLVVGLSLGLFGFVLFFQNKKVDYFDRSLLSLIRSKISVKI